MIRRLVTWTTGMLVSLLVLALPLPAAPSSQQLQRLFLAAVHAGNAAAAARLLKRGADVDSADVHGNTALMLAVGAGQPAMVDLLLAHGASVSKRNTLGQTAAALAIRAGHLSVAETIARSGGSESPIPYEPGSSLLVWAALSGDTSALDALLAGGSKVHSTEAVQAFGAAASNGVESSVAFLIGRGVDVNAHDADGVTPLMGAAASDEAVGPVGRAIALRLIRAGASVNARDNEGMTAFLYAVQHSTVAMMELLADQHADIHARDDRGRDAVALATLSGRGNAAIVEAFLRRRDAPAAATKATERLLSAVNAPNLAALAELLANGGDPNARDSGGHTLLWIAADRGNAAMVRMLLHHGARVDEPELGYSKFTPLSRAAENGHLPVVEILLTAGANPNVKVFDGYTALQRALMGFLGDQPARLRIVEALLAHGASIEASNALVEAATYGHTAIVDVLIRRGAKINSRDPQGMTALYRAAENGWPETVRTLLAHHADPRLAAPDGESPLSAAVERLSESPSAAGYREIVQMLRQHGSR